MKFFWKRKEKKKNNKIDNKMSENITRRQNNN